MLLYPTFGDLIIMEKGFLINTCLKQKFHSETKKKIVRKKERKRRLSQGAKPPLPVYA